MAAATKSGRLGLRGLYHFTNEEWEEKYRARMTDWYFWPTIFLLYLQLTIDALGAIAYFGTAHSVPLGASTKDPIVMYCSLSIDVVALVFLGGIHCSPLFRRHIVPLQSVFIVLVMVKTAAFITYDTEMWTDHSFHYLVPTGSSISITGPNAPADAAAKLWDHLATLSAFRSMQMAIISSFAPSVFNTLMGLNWWSLGTGVWITLSFIVGMALNSHMSWGTFTVNGCLAASNMGLSMFFAAAFERTQRQHFEAERRLQWELQASQMADSVLNHSLKNTLADVAGNIEMFLAGALPSQALEDCIGSLRRGVRSCKERRGYLHLVAGQYQPVMNTINLQEFGRQLLAGRGATGRFPDCTIYADEMLLNLIFDNALSNAAKHGNPQNPEVAFTIEEIPADVCADLEAGKRRFSFQVTNVAHPGSPELTPEYVQQLFAGTVEKSGRPVPTLSDGIGLTHCQMAAKLGGIALSLSQEDDIVTFSGILDAEVQVAPHPPPDRTAPNIVADFPTGLRFTILDDSLPAQRLLKFHIDRLCAPASVVCLGASAADVESFMGSALVADIVIVDQHLDWNRASYLGTNLVRELRTMQYSGFICVRSADDGPTDQALYLESGANCSVGKDLLGPVMIHRLQEDYEEFLSRQATPVSAAAGTPAAS